ncbi:UNVERIFIED_CONTAM: hypothetical protein Slati_3671900 [Sesamum latifolium]|uniref:Gag-pol polyprotein n=1 Tax=Sesamum latifolium TaxID=2727402 RepID=A0AAW2U297_9LAMI
MIARGPVGGDSYHARKAEARKAHDVTIKEVLDLEVMEDGPIIQFGRAECSGPKNSHNDALVITAMLTNYEVRRIFIDSGSSVDILSGEAYDQMQLRDIPLEKAYLNIFQAIISMYHMKIKFPTPGGVGEVQGDSLQSQKCYIEAVRKGHKMTPDEVLKETPFEKRGKDEKSEEEPEAGRGMPPKVQLNEELSNFYLEIREKSHELALK